MIVALTAVGCTRPIHRRTWVMNAGNARYDHPAQLDAAVVEPALDGRIAGVDRPGMARAIVRALERIGPTQAVYYRHPHGGGWRFGVRRGELVVTASGLRGRGGPGNAAIALEPGPRPEVAPKAVKVVGVEPPQPIDATSPELEVQCAIAFDQWVFVNGKRLGRVKAGETVVFPVTFGKSAVVGADDELGSNPVTAQYDFQPGYRYTLLIMPWLGGDSP